MTWASSSKQPRQAVVPENGMLCSEGESMAPAPSALNSRTTSPVDSHVTTPTNSRETSPARPRSCLSSRRSGLSTPPRSKGCVNFGDDVGGAPRSEPEIVKNLALRFPELAQQMVEHVLRDVGWHGGKAARKLVDVSAASRRAHQPPADSHHAHMRAHEGEQRPARGHAPTRRDEGRASRTGGGITGLSAHRP